MYHVSEPDLSSVKAKFSQMSHDDLKELLNDDTKLEEMINDAQQVKSLETEKEMLVASNHSLAEFNLTKEPQLAEGKEKLMELSEKAAELSKRVEEKVTEFKTKTGHLNLDTTLALLQTASAESEEESEVIANKFLASELDIDSFLEQFLVKRNLMHQRRVKAEKMAELLANKSSSNAAPYPPVSTPHYSSAGAPYPPASLYPMPSSVPSNILPYPSQPVSMPMPSIYR